MQPTGNQSHRQCYIETWCLLGCTALNSRILYAAFREMPVLNWLVKIDRSYSGVIQYSIWSLSQVELGVGLVWDKHTCWLENLLDHPSFYISNSGVTLQFFIALFAMVTGFWQVFTRGLTESWNSRLFPSFGTLGHR